MKKLLIIGTLACAALLSGCGNSWEVTKKSWKSDFGDLTRRVRVYDSLSKEVLWEYTGDVYVTDGSVPGNVTVIYRDSKGKIRKNDFLGQHVSFVMFEVAD